MLVIEEAVPSTPICSRAGASRANRPAGVTDPDRSPARAQGSMTRHHHPSRRTGDVSHARAQDPTPPIRPSAFRPIDVSPARAHGSTPTSTPAVAGAKERPAPQAPGVAVAAARKVRRRLARHGNGAGGGAPVNGAVEVMARTRRRRARDGDPHRYIRPPRLMLRAAPSAPPQREDSATVGRETQRDPVPPPAAGRAIAPGAGSDAGCCRTGMTRRPDGCKLSFTLHQMQSSIGVRPATWPQAGPSAAGPAPINAAPGAPRGAIRPDRCSRGDPPIWTTGSRGVRRWS